MTTISLFAFFALLTLTTASPLTYNDGIAVLDDDNFRGAVRLSNFFLVHFHSPDVVESNLFSDEFSAAVIDLADRFPGVAFGRANVDAVPNRVEHLEIKEFPAVKLYKQVEYEMEDYDGNKTTAGIIEWIEKRIQKLLVEVSCLEEAKNVTTEREHVVYYFGNTSSPMYANILKAASAFMDVSFGVVDSEEIRKEYGVQENDVILFRSKNTEQSKLTNLTKYQELEKFLDVYRFPVIGKYSRNAFSTIALENLDAVFLLRNNNEDSAHAEEALTQVSKDLRGKILFFVLDAGNYEGTHLMETFDVKEGPFPRIGIYQASKNDRKYILDREISAKNIKIFLANYFQDNLKPFIKTAPKPDKLYDGDIRVVVGQTYQRLVIDNDKDVLIEFYSPYCHHCQRFAPTYAELATKLNVVQGLVVAKIDVTVNDGVDVKVHGYPTVYLYPKGQKDKPILFEGERNVDALVEFLKENGTVDIEA